MLLTNVYVIIGLAFGLTSNELKFLRNPSPLPMWYGEYLRA